MSVICNAESSKWTGKTEYPSLINNNEPIELILLTYIPTANNNIISIESSSVVV